MTLLEKVDDLKTFLDKKDELAEEVKINNKAIETCKKELADMMLAEETTKVTRAGFSYSLQAKTRYSKKAGKDSELFELLRENDMGSLIKETVNAQTLQGAMSNMAAENNGELPDEFAEVINVYDFFDVTKRKA